MPTWGNHTIFFVELLAVWAAVIALAAFALRAAVRNKRR
jgi:hypothetical protein